MSRFECQINNCGETHSYKHPLSYFLHIRDDHSRTYRENKEYIDAKINVLKVEDEDAVGTVGEPYQEAKKVVDEMEENGEWAI